MNIGANIGVGRAGLAPLLNSFSPSKLVLGADSADVEWLFIGDSMGDNVGEMPGAVASYLASAYPKYTVHWIPWNDGTGSYGSPTVLQTGTGSHVLRIYAACVAGTRPTYLLGSKYAAAIAARSPKLVLVLHGLNVVGSGVYANMARGEFLSLLEEVRVSFPLANIAMVIENPKRDDTLMEVITEYVGAGTTVSIKQVLEREATIQPDITLLDVYSKFISRGKDTSLYSDPTHGNTVAGTALYLEAFRDQFDRAAPGVFAPGTPLMSVLGTNLLLNGDFASFATAPPTSWTNQNAVASAKELTNKYGAHSWACRITAGATGAPNLRQIITGAGLAAAIADGYVSIATRLFRPTGGAASIGRPNAFIVGTGAQTGVSLRSDTEGQGRYWWRFQPDIPIRAAATGIQVLTYADTATTGMDTTHPTDIDRVSVVVGRNPKDF